MRINADQAYISRIEAGQMNVTLESIEQIATALGVKPVSLFEDDPLLEIGNDGKN